MDGCSYRLFGDGWLNVFDAYNGSLDAAKALHEALLPGWGWDVGDTDASVSKHPLWVTEHAGGGPARAWLLAILKAYEAQQ